MKPDALLLRQINEAWEQDGYVTSQAFKPTRKDQGKLSTYDGSKITAEDSWEHFTVVLGYSSIGVMAVTVDECDAHGLPVVPDPMTFPEHVFVDFRGIGRSQVEKRAKFLRGLAEKRGWQYRPNA